MFLRSRLVGPVFTAIILAGALLLASVQRGFSQDSGTEPSGFRAEIAGAYDGEVSGAGVLVLLPQAGFDKQGYFFLADGRGLRPHGVTFVLPRGVTPGKYDLGSPSPLDLGKTPSVRVDRDRGDSVQSFEKNTAGTLALTAFPADEDGLTGAHVAGSFAFETENPEGQRIKVRGKFSFMVK